MPHNRKTPATREAQADRQNSTTCSNSGPKSSLSKTDAATVLIADDDPITRRLFRYHLQNEGYTVIEACDGQQAIRAAERLSREIATVALLDLRMPGLSGLECLRYLNAHFPDVRVLVISGVGDVAQAVSAIKEGADDYLAKPVDPDQLLARVEQVIRSAEVAREHRSLKATIGGHLPRVSPVMETAQSQELWQRVRRLSQVDQTVLILGQSGTGKTTIARSIHQLSPRADGPFVPVSCAALPRDLIEAELFGHEKGAFTGADTARAGRAELAHGGTLFLDEIGDLPLDLQPKLLTFLEDRVVRRIGGLRDQPVDVRVLAATHQDLEAMVQERTFREDLFYRLETHRLHVPPLAGRAADILELAQRMLSEIAARNRSELLQLTDAAAERLCQHPWPGNIRELHNVLQRASAFCCGGQITSEDLKFSRLPTPDQQPIAETSPRLAGRTWKDIERQAIAETLQACGHNKAAAARMLGLSERTIYNKVREYGLDG